MTRKNFLTSLLAVTMLMFTSSKIAAFDKGTPNATVMGIGYVVNSDTHKAKICRVGTDTKYSKFEILETLIYLGDIYTVTTIMPGTFEGVQMDTLVIPKSITKIDNNSFHKLTSVKAVIFSDGEDQVTIGYEEDSNDGLFCPCTNLNYTYLGRDFKYEFQNEEKPFQKVENLKKLEVGPTVTNISGSAFNGSGLTSVDFSKAKNLTTIHDGAFGNSQLTTVSIPKTVTEIDANAFGSCEALQSVIFEDGNTPLKFNKKSNDVHSYAFKGCDNMAVVTIGRPITYTKYNDDDYREWSPFYEVKVKSAIIRDSAQYVTPYMFYNCDDLEILSIGGGIQKVGVGCISACNGVKTLVFASGPTTLEIENANEQTDLFFPFANDAEVETISLGRNISYPYSGQKTFFSAHPETLKSVSLEKGIREVTANMFNGCTKLNYLYINTDTVQIDGNAFKGCTSLSAIYQNGDTSFKEDAFNGCTALSTLTFLGTTHMDAYCFNTCDNIKSVTVSYSANPKKDAGSFVSFSNNVYSNATLTNICDNWNFTADFSDCYPWSMFYKRAKYTSNSYVTFDTNNSESLSNMSVCNASMKYTIKPDTAIFVVLPFQVSSYYFGADASIYSMQLSSSAYPENNTTTHGGVYYTCDYTKIDIDAIRYLPVGMPLLIISKHADNEIKAAVDLFTSKEISTKVDDLGDSSDEADNVSLLTSQTTVTPELGSNTTYTLLDGMLTKVNSENFTIPAFTPYYIYKNADDLPLWIRANAWHTIILPSGYRITPIAELGGYYSFYSSSTNVEVVTANDNGTVVTPQVYTITGISSTGKLELHQVSDGVINKGQGVIILGDTGFTNVLRAVTEPSTDTDAYTNNLLSGVNDTTAVDDLVSGSNTFVYVLSCNSNNEEIGLYRCSTGRKIPAHKAYLDPTKIPAAAKSLSCFTLDTPTAVQAINGAATDDATTYDLSGRKVVTKHPNSIYINNHMKTLSK